MATEDQGTNFVIPDDYDPNMGLKHGRVNEIRCFFHVKPGHEEQLRKDLVEFSAGEKRRSIEAHLIAGVQNQTYSLFDDGTRLLFATDFDTDWDPYIDDSVGLVGAAKYWMWWQHLEEFSAFGPDNLPSMPEAKYLMNASRETATTHIRAFPDWTVAQLHKATQVFAAFEKVLNDPDGAQALQENPALAPLLDQAAD